jgi:serine/threonine-protein kinase HipA
MMGVFLETGSSFVRVGTLVLSRDRMLSFVFDDDYISLGPDRPILSSSFEAFSGEEETIIRMRNSPDLIGGRQLPPFFDNLLPQGALRELILSGMPPGNHTGLDILEWVGEDLPGAVVVRREQGVRKTGVAELPPETLGGIRFSLAGVQMKLSMLKGDESLTLPAFGTNGNIIAKLPSDKIPHLPEVEFTSMRLAEEVGIDVPFFELVSVEDIEGIPRELLKGGPTALAIDRFDRPKPGKRIHIEDFNQIVGGYDIEKYSKANEAAVIKIATKFGGNTAKPFLQAVRRVAVNILLGNTDAHLKNWSLWYPEPSVGQLSPAYDIVAYSVYDRSDTMALSFYGTKNSRLIESDRFAKAARFVGMAEARVKKEVKNTVEEAADTWPELLHNLPMPEKYQRLLIDRTSRLALTNEFGCDFAVPSAPTAGIRKAPKYTK